MNPIKYIIGVYLKPGEEKTLIDSKFGIAATNFYDFPYEYSLTTNGSCLRDLYFTNKNGTASSTISEVGTITTTAITYIIKFSQICLGNISVVVKHDKNHLIYKVTFGNNIKREYQKELAGYLVNKQISLGLFSSRLNDGEVFLESTCGLKNMLIFNMYNCKVQI